MARAPHAYAESYPSGEERLWYSVVRQALGEAIGPDPRLRAQAFEWITRRNRKVGGFEWCCSVLGLGAQRLRETVRPRHAEATRRWEGAGDDAPRKRTARTR